ncbi:hypothetical protein, partial [Tychonema bourrellyi]|uniref:hypothetical protein n=1 Tax=Tychonema bourrellyi TaxID=54313 RepID=UPI001C558498
MPDGFQLFYHARHMIARLVAIELCETACLSALFFKKRCQMGSIEKLGFAGALPNLHRVHFTCEGSYPFLIRQQSRLIAYPNAPCPMP